MGSAKASADAEPGSVFGNICHGLRNPYQATGMSTSNGQEPIGYRLYALTTLNNGLENPNEVQSARECILKSEDYGVPQARHRIIIVGVRPIFLKSLLHCVRHHLNQLCGMQLAVYA